MGHFTSRSKRSRNENVLEVEEIVTNILLRLPPKSLLICKSVCKTWRRLVCSSSFIHLHLIQSQENPTYICHIYKGKGKEHELVGRINGETTESFFGWDKSYSKGMITCFNGLICCFNLKRCRINICNPATREVLILPTTPIKDSDPKLGVSFGDTIHEYKVFQFFYKEEEEVYECMVYSSTTGSWKSIGNFTYGPDSSYQHVCVNRTVYWRFPGYILAVDWEESFHIISIPEDETNKKRFLIDLEGCLCLVGFVLELEFNRFRFDIWALEDSEQSVWVKKWSDYMSASKVMYRLIDVVAWKNNVLFGYNGGYAFYNVETRNWREFNWEYGNWRGFKSYGGSDVEIRTAFCRTALYTESLLPCKGHIDSKIEDHV